jgi:hypothetical protein
MEELKYWHCEVCRRGDKKTFLLRRRNDTIAICNDCYYKKYATKGQKFLYLICRRFNLPSLPESFLARFKKEPKGIL